MKSTVEAQTQIYTAQRRRGQESLQPNLTPEDQISQKAAKSGALNQC